MNIFRLILMSFCFIVNSVVFSFADNVNVNQATDVVIEEKVATEEITANEKDCKTTKDSSEVNSTSKDRVSMLNFDVKPLFDDYVDEEDVSSDNDIADPLYYYNLGIFHFNDFVMNYFLEPVAYGYKTVTPDFARIGVSNFFENLQAPVNVFNKLFQLKLADTSTEFLRFTINLTLGVAGFYDAADGLFGIKKKEASFGQTLGYYGVGHGIYLIWPLFGPSSLRETAGLVGDKLMSPSTYLSYIYLDFYQSASIYTFDKVNDTSFKLGDYDLLVGSAIDPYSALKDAFVQYNIRKVEKAKNH